MESMSNAPYVLPKARAGMRLGHGEVVDSVIKDGLWDPYGNVHMGICAEQCSRCARPRQRSACARRCKKRSAAHGADWARRRREHGIGRDAQDAHAAESYARAAAAAAAGWFADEVVAVEVPSGRKGAPPTLVTADESVSKGGDAASLAKCVRAARGRAAHQALTRRANGQAVSLVPAHRRHCDRRQRLGRVRRLCSAGARLGRGGCAPRAHAAGAHPGLG